MVSGAKKTVPLTMSNARSMVRKKNTPFITSKRMSIVARKTSKIRSFALVMCYS
jgi:hypothetical protein